MYVITGATGNTGKGIAEILLENGKEVRAIARNADKLKDLADKGAEILTGDLKHTEFLLKAFTGAETVYAMIPPNYTAENFREYQNVISDSIVNAIKTSGVKNVVMLSSVGAHLPEGAGVVQGLYDFEQKLNALPDVNCVYLRAGFFMENIFPSIGMIKNMGIYGTPLKSDFKLGYVATQDISIMGAKYMLNVKFSGKVVQYVLGTKDYTPAEFTKIMGTAIGKPELPYVQFPYADAEAAMGGMGMTPDMAASMVQLMKTINEGKGYESSWRNESNTTETSAEEFVKEFTAVYNAG